MQKKKVAILGGGMSSLTTAFELTNPANDQHQGYEVTVYQLGWRLGGKAASGRNMDPAYSCRIEEDGLHVFYGFYDNAFSLIQSCYHELDRAPDAPLASWEDAFKPHSYVEYYQLFLNKWRKMHVTYPRNLLTPGGNGSGGNGSLGLLESYAAPAVERIRGVYHDSAASRKEDGGSKRKVDPKVRLIVRLLYEEYQEEMVLAERAGTVGGPETLNFKGQMLASAQVLANWIASEPEALAAWVGTNSSLMADLIKVVDYSPEGELFKELGLQILCLILDEFRKLLWDVLKVGVKSSFTAYQVWVLINWGIGLQSLAESIPAQRWRDHLRIHHHHTDLRLVVQLPGRQAAVDGHGGGDRSLDAVESGPHLQGRLFMEDAGRHRRRGLRPLVSRAEEARRQVRVFLASEEPGAVEGLGADREDPPRAAGQAKKR
jgi:hypothetical protein